MTQIENRARVEWRVKPNSTLKLSQIVVKAYEIGT